MSHKPAEKAEEPGLDERQEEEEESDEYDVEDDDDDGEGEDEGEEDEDEEDETEAVVRVALAAAVFAMGVCIFTSARVTQPHNPAAQQASLTAMLLGAQALRAANGDYEEDDEDDGEYEDAPVGMSATSSVAGAKRSREEDEDVEAGLAGEDGALEAAEEGVAKKARTIAAADEDEGADEV
ncbi:uncharacterized protein BXZ73DRAFT_100898 [Epithele typhae]|uniref:uncharacterized protein n=1 Tax=Epithele typhae TaxID=378194 RepID=UPI0020078544|nr:uncharacterized protein BXZ73DRAFT_100898 [Epithele typhae]KAH9934057.1 hypothetical protein BXZ73DRAFT_100898 [Epithele typhae]